MSVVEEINETVAVAALSAVVRVGDGRGFVVEGTSLMASAMDWEWTDTNPVLPFLKQRAKRGLKEGMARTRYLTEDEETRLLTAATPYDAKIGKHTSVREAIALAIDTGLRREELFGLTWKQIDLRRGLIDTGTKTKSGRPRKVPIPARAAQILTQLPRALDGGFVLVNPATGTRYVQMNKGLKAATRRAKIDDLEWHDLRRTAGCRWLQRDGKSMEEVSILLGHSSVVVTEQRYAFLEAEAVAASFRGTKTDTSNSGVIPFGKVAQ